MSEFLRELLTCKRVNKEHVTSDDLTTYNEILLMTNAHLEGYQPQAAINVSLRKKIRVIIATLLAQSKGRGFKSELRLPLKKY